MSGIASKSGDQLEDKVGAHYLLTLLAQSEPRGLPGTTINTLKFQSAGEGYPLDDITVAAHDSQGKEAILEIQVKRKLTFTRDDQQFQKIVGQIINASHKPEFNQSNYKLAIALARTSAQIDGAYQDVLTWARAMTDPDAFIARCTEKDNGSANKSTRLFIEVFKEFLNDNGESNDNGTVFGLLKKLQILIFDFTVKHSQADELVNERCANVLHADDKKQASKLWGSLVTIAQDQGACGGTLSRDQLISEIRNLRYRLTGEREYTSSRRVIAELTALSLKAIPDTILDIHLPRSDYLQATRAALEKQRYVEIRGEAGVGKSAVLKHLALQASEQSCVILLSPKRTPGKGWQKFSSDIRFDGTARELLIDLESSGGGTLFIDNLDFFTEDQRTTVSDFIRTAAEIDGFSVIATARHNFGQDESNWLPLDELDRLGVAQPVVVHELSDTEINQIRLAAPKLAPLLDVNHPARTVVRNLFKLSQLVEHSIEGNDIITEVDMAMNWWDKVAYVKTEKRECKRLLTSLAKKALENNNPMDVSNRTTISIDALIENETLTDGDHDHVMFRHDIFTDWAISNLLYSDHKNLELVPLNRFPPPWLERSIELLARMYLEKDDDVTKWLTLLEQTGLKENHNRWRRAVLLAIIRSENSTKILTKLTITLLSNNASLLRELIKTVQSVEVVPLRNSVIAPIKDTLLLPNNFTVPISSSWTPLIIWLICIKDRLPPDAIADVVDLYSDWSLGMLGLGPLTPLIAEQLYLWLMEIESTDEQLYLSNTFDRALISKRPNVSHEVLQYGFLSICHRKPDLASQYLKALVNRKNNRRETGGVLKFSGPLAQAAPAELAELTLNSLIEEEYNQAENGRSHLQGALSFDDYNFYPVSPAQGPFFSLLQHSPKQGLSLIHKLIDHAIQFHTGNKIHDEHALEIYFPYGKRIFRWTKTYDWSRYSPYQSVTSALMALEAWAHHRIDNGEKIEDILPDVLGPQDSPAAYLLIAVDIILSHWSEPTDTAIPFLACPQLLYLDRERIINDTNEFPSLLALRPKDKEPVGVVSLKDLMNRNSRGLELTNVLGIYALSAPSKMREQLMSLLSAESERLGTPDREAALNDPAFMVLHAINRTNPKNWRTVVNSSETNGDQTSYEYVPPKEEVQHLEPLQKTSEARWSSTDKQNSIYIVLNDPSKSSTDFADSIAKWVNDIPINNNADDILTEEQITAAIAMIVLRDGDEQLRALHKTWARNIFYDIFQEYERSPHRNHQLFIYDPLNIAFSGFIHFLKHNSSSEEIKKLLEVCAIGKYVLAGRFGLEMETLSAIDSQLPISMLRIAFVACVTPANRLWGANEETEKSKKEYKENIRTAIDAELKWLTDNGVEPHWPHFPSSKPRRRRGLHLSYTEEDDAVILDKKAKETTTWEVDSRAASVWLGNLIPSLSLSGPMKLISLIDFYTSWTIMANGQGMEPNEEPEGTPLEWNNEYYRALALCFPSLKQQEIDKLIKLNICSLPDKPFFDILSSFLPDLDAVYLNGSEVDTLAPRTIDIRETFCARMLDSVGWHWLTTSYSSTVETHIGPAIAALLFNSFIPFGSGPKCYLTVKGIDLVDSSLPVLEKLVKGGAALFPALCFLNLLEVSHRSKHMPLLIQAATSWLASYPDNDDFWINRGIGQRVCNWLDVELLNGSMLEENSNLIAGLDLLLSGMIRLGISDAKGIEDRISRDPR